MAALRIRLLTRGHLPICQRAACSSIQEQLSLRCGRSSSLNRCVNDVSGRQLLHLYSSYVNTHKYIHTTSVIGAEVVKGPAFAESISEGDIKWLKNVGDFVSADEVVAEIETDKTAVEVPCPISGTITELLVEDGMRVEAKQELFIIEPGEGANKPPVKPQAQPTPVKEIKKESAPPPTLTPSPPPSGPPPPSAPKMRTSSVPASSVQIKPVPTVAQVPKPSTVNKGGDTAITGARAETRSKMNRMRLRIADRLKGAQNTYAMLTTFQEVDMSGIVEMRKKYQDAFVKKHGVKLGFMSPFVRAAAYALHDQPVVNAVIDESEIIYRHFIDMSIAVASPRGLVVPVLRNVEAMDYATIEKEIMQMGIKARDGKLAMEDMDGGTFTISNGGVFGSLFGTPIINPPQSAILGLHAIFDKPVAIGGKVEIRPIMVIALTYDHRLIDGREAVTFLKKIKTSVEDPRTILLDI